MIVASIVAACVGVALIGVAIVFAKDSPPETTSQRIPVGEDGYVVREEPDTVFGGRDTLVSVARPDYYAVTYLKFQVTTPAGFRVQAMSLQLQADAKPPASLQVRSVLSSDWSEKDLSYATRPGLGEVLGGEPTVSATNLVSFDVSAAVPAPGEGPARYSFAVTNASDSETLTLFAGEHGAGAPALAVTFIEIQDTETLDGHQRGDGSGKPNPSGTASPGASASPSAGPSASVTPGQPNPPGNIPAGRTLCGVGFIPKSGETYAQGVTRVDNLYGGLEAFRTFYTGAPAAWPGNAGKAGRTVVVSFKYNPKEILGGSRDSYLRNWFAQAPRDRDVYWVYYHEPEDNIEAGVFTAADYRAAWRRIAGLADAAGNPKLHATLVLMDWSVFPQSGRKWKDYYAGSDVIDVLGWDVYNFNFTDPKYPDAATMVNRVATVSKAEGKPWGIAELGTAKLPGDTSGSGRAAWLTAAGNASIKGGALWVTYFDVDFTRADWRLLDAPSQKAWRGFCDA